VQKNKNALLKLVTVAILYSLYAIVESFNFSNEVCFWFLLLIASVAFYLRAYGYLDTGLEKVVKILNKTSNIAPNT
jgi:hypothetical protein